MPLFEKYALQLAENEITLKVANINMRAALIISAPDDRSKRAADEYLSRIEAGKLGSIGDNFFLDGMLLCRQQSRLLPRRQPMLSKRQSIVTYYGNQRNDCWRCRRRVKRVAQNARQIRKGWQIGHGVRSYGNSISLFVDNQA
jgi:hypothetical protein